MILYYDQVPYKQFVVLFIHYGAKLREHTYGYWVYEKESGFILYGVNGVYEPEKSPVQDMDFLYERFKDCRLELRVDDKFACSSVRYT